MILYETPQTKNPAYIKATPMNPVGILVHSTGCTNPKLNRYVDAPEYLGRNIYVNHWNQSKATKSMHGFIGKDKNGDVAICHTQPYNTACWGCGSGVRGSYNRNPTGHVQFEICEDNAPRSGKTPTSAEKEYYWAAIKAAEDYCVYLCQLLHLNAYNITSHYEAHDLGYASNHGDPKHWMRLYDDSMDKFRARVARRLIENIPEPEPVPEPKPVDPVPVEPKKISDTIVKLKITREENATFFKRNIGDIEELPLDEYLLGVVPAEIGNPHIEAAKAQAIAARTYAYMRVKNGNVIDDTTLYQAYRAPRSINNAYARAHQAVKETMGQVLTYNGKVIETAVYSHSNGGTMVSSKDRWGGDRPYLITADDPWTKATGEPKNGHAVGMSQVGAIYAAEHGVSYKGILAFYYPGTEITLNEAIAPTTPPVVPEEPPKIPLPIVERLYEATVVTMNPLSLNIWSNIRKSSSLKKVARGAVVDVLEEVNSGWAKVSYQGVVGYSDRKYLKPLNKDMTYQAKVVTMYPLSLNIWREARKSTSLAKVPKGAIVTVLSEVDATWAKVRYGDIVGYSDRKYLKRV